MLYISMPHSRHRLSSSLAHQPVSGAQLGMSFVRVVLPGSPYPPAVSLCVSWLCSVAGHSPSPSAAAASAAAGCVVVFFLLVVEEEEEEEEAAAAESKSGRQNGQRQPHSEFSPSPFRLNHNNDTCKPHTTTRSSDSSSQVFSFRSPC